MRHHTRICQIISSFHPVVGGAEKATLSLGRELVRQGQPVTVLTRRQPGSRASESVDGLAILRAGFPVRGKLGSLSFGLHSVWLLATRLRGHRTLHIQNLDTPLLLGMIGRGLMSRRLVVTAHSELDLVRRMSSPPGRLRMAIMRRMVHRFTAISPAVARQLVSIGVEEDRIYAIPNGVDTLLIRPSEEVVGMTSGVAKEEKHRSVTVLFVGRLIPLKQVDVLLRAMAEADLPGTSLEIVGHGPSRTELEALATSLGLRAVRFAGQVDDVAAALRAADVFVLPSRKEGLSVALMEAMAAGLACVVSDLPGNRALIDHGVNGLIVPSGHVSALASALQSLSADMALRNELGKAARSRIESHYSVARVARLHADLYESLG